MKALQEAIDSGEPIYTLPPEEMQPEVSIRADFLTEQRDWSHANLGIKALHDRGILGEGVTVAILDTGIDIEHPDLRKNIVERGHKDFTGSRSGFMDRQSHGTHVAGTYGAAADGKGLIGIAPRCKLMAVKVLGDNGSGSSSGIAAGIRHAADAGAEILNMSLGGPSPDTATRAAIQYAISKGCWVVCAAGNDGRRVNSYPGHYPESIAVAATDRDNRRASFSTINQENDIAAPGVNIMSTLPDGRYGSYSGTSMATPAVGACLALVRGELKRLGLPIPSQTKVMEAMKATADDIAPAGDDEATGAGLINTAKMLDRLVGESPPVAPPPVTPPPPGDAPSPWWLELVISLLRWIFASGTPEQKERVRREVESLGT